MSEGNSLAGASSYQSAPSMKDILRSAKADAAGSDLDRLVERGASLLDAHRSGLVKAEHAYQVTRARMVADAQRELAEFQLRTRKQLDRFDQDHRDEVEHIEHEIRQLEMIQEMVRP